MARPLAMATRGKQGVTIRELAYLAGVLDSDGCLSISKMNSGIQRTKNPRYVFSINVVNTSETLMKWLVEKFGGRYNHRHKQVSPNHKMTYDWYCHNGNALWLLKKVKPYLIIKPDRADIAISFISGWKTTQKGRGSMTDPEEVARREKCYLKIKELNQTGPVQPQRLNPLAPSSEEG